MFALLSVRDVGLRHWIRCYNKRVLLTMDTAHIVQRVYETVARLSVCLSVRLSTSSHHSHAAAAGLLLSAVPAGDIARQRRLSTAYSSTLWFVCVRCYQVLVGLAGVAVVIYLVSCDISCASCSNKGKHQTHGRNSVKCQFSTDFFKVFYCQILQ